MVFFYHIRQLLRSFLFFLSIRSLLGVFYCTFFDVRRLQCKTEEISLSRTFFENKKCLDRKKKGKDFFFELLSTTKKYESVELLGDIRQIFVASKGAESRRRVFENG